MEKASVMFGNRDITEEGIIFTRVTNEEKDTCNSISTTFKELLDKDMKQKASLARKDKLHSLRTVLDPLLEDDFSPDKDVTVDPLDQKEEVQRHKVGMEFFEGLIPPKLTDMMFDYPIFPYSINSIRSGYSLSIGELTDRKESDIPDNYVVYKYTKYIDKDMQYTVAKRDVDLPEGWAGVSYGPKEVCYEYLKGLNEFKNITVIDSDAF